MVGLMSFCVLLSGSSLLNELLGLKLSLLCVLLMLGWVEVGRGVVFLFQMLVQLGLARELTAAQSTRKRIHGHVTGDGGERGLSGVVPLLLLQLLETTQ